MHGLHGLPALHLWRRSALPLDGGLQLQTQVAAAGTAFQEAVQALGADVAEGDGLGSWCWLISWEHFKQSHLTNASRHPHRPVFDWGTGGSPTDLQDLANNQVSLQQKIVQR